MLAQSDNRIEESRDPTAHAEMLAIRAAAARAAAISFARIRRLYFGAYDPKGGAVDHGPRFFQQATRHHAPEVIGGMAESSSATLLKAFFEARR